MKTLEHQLRDCSRSWKTLLGAPLVTALIFLAIASGSIAIDKPKAEKPLPTTFAYVPPKPIPQQKTTPPLSSSFSESFKFDPTTAALAPDIPLEFLEVSLDPHVNPGLAVELDMKRPFEIQKPVTTAQFQVFERHQVDEIPVWLYGPMPDIPSQLRTVDGEALVLYVVTDRGKTENVYILDSTDERFNPGIKEAIVDWTYRPARKAGKPVSVWVQHRVSYRPSSKSPFSL